MFFNHKIYIKKLKNLLAMIVFKKKKKKKPKLVSFHCSQIIFIFGYENNYLLIFLKFLNTFPIKINIYKFIIN